MYQNAQGVQVRGFLEENEARLKDKHFLYVVGTNLEEDTYLRRRSTRGSKDGWVAPWTVVGRRCLASILKSCFK